MIHISVRLGIPAAVILILIGCGSNGLERVVVQGNVTYADQPVAEGQVRFVPNAGTPGPQSFAEIRQGKYFCDFQGGVPVGTQRVEIIAFDPNDKSLGGPGVPPRKQLLPPQYNRESTLTLEVTGEASQMTHDFALE